MYDGKFVKEIREDYGFTQKEFAYYLNLNIRTVQNWESRGCSNTVFELLNRCHWSDRSRADCYGDDNANFKVFMRKLLDDCLEIYPFKD